jgi:hypothetical protein
MNAFSSLRGLATATLATVLLGGAAHADTLTGQVVDPNGVGIVGATLTFTNGATPLNPVTGLNGVFAFVLNPGTYDISIDPGVAGVAPMQLFGVQVAGLTNLGTIQLQVGYTISGQIVDPAGLPVFGVDTDVRDAVTGARLFTPGDNTDLTGLFSVTVPAGTYRFDIRPPADPLLPLFAPRSIEGVVVAGNVDLGIQAVETGFAISGIVRDGRTLLPVEDADIDVEDAITGEKLLTPNDNSDPLGAFLVVVPTGYYTVTIDSPVGSALRGQRRHNLLVGANTPLGLVDLEPGFVVSGLVTDAAGLPIQGADIDVLTVPGDSAWFLSNDNTDANGNFSVVVPAGSCYLTVEPRPGSGLVAARTNTLQIAANTALPTFRLATGVTLSGTVTKANGAPEVGCDIDVIDPATGLELPTPGDATDANGFYSVVVPAGTYDLAFQPEEFSLSRVDRIAGVSVQGATIADHRLVNTPIYALAYSPGEPDVAATGGLLPLFLAYMNLTAGTVPTLVSIVNVDPLGNEHELLRPLFLNLPVGAGMFTATLLPTPPVSPALHGLTMRMELRFDDPATGAEQDHDAVTYVIR